ncbi:lysozyme [Actinacidiphila paucisporea]|uniref:Lysozyme n=1 Tax=Actinacidiphila paucisporea TaxID=310782 RepID=A0A1M6V8A7_9ACTN|nr:lysozyme [Actinacidiphila paucisporea]SHK77713.1 Lyzozyme M1 (1,4-beta-N-acetylmuramidase), GH25 family [Actinacidiphila paucisporea]
MSHGALSVVHGNGSVRTRLAPLAGSLVTMLALALAAPGTAHAANYGHMTHPDLDWLGSQIQIHEGRSAPGDAKAGTATVTQTAGMDVSSYQGSVNWAGAWSKGAKFAYVKATEGTSYTNPAFTQQYNGSYNVGMIRGSYHFALPDVSTGAAQADYFAAHGGGWSKDGKTLPGALDMEYNPYGATCYGKTASGMVSWITSFSKEYHAKTGRYPTIYTSTSWWSTCTGNSTAFSADNALWVARYASAVGALPANWGYQTFWQWADTGTFPGDQDRFNGALDRVKAYANG